MLKNVLIVVDDIEKSIEFYKDLFGLQVILKNEGNVILSEGLVLLYIFRRSQYRKRHYDRTLGNDGTSHHKTV